MCATAQPAKAAKLATGVNKHELRRKHKDRNFSGFCIPNCRRRSYLRRMDISIPAPRPKYPDHIAVAAPIGMRESIRRAATLRGMTTAAFIREAVQERLSQVAVSSQIAGG